MNSEVKNNPMYQAATDTKLLDSIIETGERKPQVKEAAFKRYLLPILLADKEADTSKWLELVGSWYRGVDVIDDASNEVMFTVPPLIGTAKSILHKPTETTGIPHKLETAERKRKTAPALAGAMIRETIEKNFKVIEDPEVSEQWRTIYQRYGIELPESESANGSGGKKQKVFKNEARDEL